ncbi:MAG TPA: serine/threonine-protein kinase [Thermoanaerobaculia bacterium]|nr:serine/threonine-protein kinase [Thermoanaerobaculia bacterium]
MPGSSTGSPTVAASGARPAFVAARFTPGTVIDDRYRIVSLLGEGGMGEVYRADDMKLGQRVALKYIPPDVSSDRPLFDRLTSEVLIGRQISHPNVCRIYDIVDVDGQFFISMQYIDGEDLGSLLRRIGRLPSEKALALARDICAGLAAAHDHGIVHRDLKPGNVMVDSRGRALVADFGLAVVLDEMRSSHRSAGTPAYMAPEQITGGEITLRTDIYALGLVLYEIFTGKRVFGGASMQEISEQHAVSKTRPSSIAREIDPNVERVILRCLEENPAERPVSAHAVIASLPGSDPLAAAIAAGDTPSPDMVALAGKTGALSPGQAWSLFGAAVVSLLIGAWASGRWQLSEFVPNIKSREALTDRARDLSAAFGFPPAADEHVEFGTDQEYLAWLAGRATSMAAISAALSSTPPSSIRFLYRASPRQLAAGNTEGLVTESDPAENLPGMSTIVLDHHGRLVYLRRVPEPRAEFTGTVPFDWRGAFGAASLDLERFHPVPPLWTPPYGFDQRSAWVGHYANRPDLDIRVEAASHNGRAVYFQVIEPWTRPTGLPVRVPVGSAVFAIWNVAVIAASVIFARRNILRGRGDKRGALRLGAFVAICSVVGMIALADHVTDVSGEYQLMTGILAAAVYDYVMVWLIYLAVEPYVRRQWPRILITWNRVICGRLRDPLVGREILIAAIVAGWTVVITRLEFPVGVWLHIRNVVPRNPLTMFSMQSPVGAAQTVSQALLLGTVWSMAWLTMLIIFRLVFRREAVAFVVVWISIAMVGLSGGAPLFRFAIGLAALAPGIFYVLLRHGLFALAATVFFRQALLTMPATFDLNAWYSFRSTAILALLIAVAGYGFYTSLAGKPMFGAAMLEEQPAI